MNGYVPFVLASKRTDQPPTVWGHYRDREAAESGRANIPADSCFGGPDDYEPVPLPEFQARVRAFYLRDPEEITGEDWEAQLGMLPPLRWEVTDGVEWFLCLEFLSWDLTWQYAKLDGRHYRRVVDVRDASTWLTRGLIETWLAGRSRPGQT